MNLSSCLFSFPSLKFIPGRGGSDGSYIPEKYRDKIEIVECFGKYGINDFGSDHVDCELCKNGKSNNLYKIDGLNVVPGWGYNRITKLWLCEIHSFE